MAGGVQTRPRCDRGSGIGANCGNGEELPTCRNDHGRPDSKTGLRQGAGNGYRPPMTQVSRPSAEESVRVPQRGADHLAAGRGGWAGDDSVARGQSLVLSTIDFPDLRTASVAFICEPACIQSTNRRSYNQR